MSDQTPASTGNTGDDQPTNNLDGDESSSKHDGEFYSLGVIRLIICLFSAVYHAAFQKISKTHSTMITRKQNPKPVVSTKRSQAEAGSSDQPVAKRSRFAIKTPLFPKFSKHSKTAATDLKRSTNGNPSQGSLKVLQKFINSIFET